MAFHLNPEVQQVAQRHIEDAYKLEETEAKRVLRKYREIRGELRDRLDTMPEGTFSAQKLRGVLLQVELAILAMTKSLKEGINDSAAILAETGADHLVEEINKWNDEYLGAIVPINLDAVAVATDTQNMLFSKYESNLDGYGANVYSQVANQLTQSMIEELPLSQVTRRLGQVLNGEEWKLLRLARTELHHVYGMGKLNGMRELVQESIPDLKKTLFHPMDHRTGEDSKHAAELDLIVPVTEPFRYKWDGKMREFMTPPDRPNDRSILVPYREAWKD